MAGKNTYRIPRMKYFEVEIKCSNECGEWTYRCRKCRAMVTGSQRTDHLKTEHKDIFEQYLMNGKSAQERSAKYRTMMRGPPRLVGSLRIA